MRPGKQTPTDVLIDHLRQAQLAGRLDIDRPVFEVLADSGRVGLAQITASGRHVDLIRYPFPPPSVDTVKQALNALHVMFAPDQGA